MASTAVGRQSLSPDSLSLAGALTACARCGRCDPRRSSLACQGNCRGLICHALQSSRRF